MPSLALAILVLLPSASARVLLSSRSTGFLAYKATTCGRLKNQGTHFTAEISVGTPPQNFDVVADTGSDNVIINSCLCVDAGYCDSSNKCFRGINHSSTFSLEGVAEDGAVLPTSMAAPVSSLVIEFGSGEIESVVASDVVTVGKVQAKMDHSLLLMVSKKLDFGGPFEGILGLGLPSSRKSMPATEQGAEVAQQQDLASVVNQKGFLETAGISRFSMCFNDGGEDGVLRLSPPQAEVQLGSIGQVHWALDFRGITVLAAQTNSSGAPSTATTSRSGTRSQFCDPNGELVLGQETVCGGIPDSGTTLLMGPQEHLLELFGMICEAWPACKEKSEGQELAAQLQVFNKLLENCESWLDSGMSDMPTLHLHVAGAGGEEQTLVLPPSAYLMEAETQEMKYTRKHLMGVFDVIEEEPTGKNIKICMPAFGKQDYNTVKNGPVWILGTPIFYQYQVGYDLKSTPPGISFVAEECGACNAAGEESKPAFLTDRRQRHRSKESMPRQIRGPPRIPALDTSLPL